MPPRPPLGSTKDILAEFKKAKAGPVVAEPHMDHKGLALIWKQAIPKSCPSVLFVPTITGKQMGQFKHMLGRWGSKDAGGLLLWIIQNWIEYAKYVKDQAGLKIFPKSPSTDFLLKYSNEAKNYWGANSHIKPASPAKPTQTAFAISSSASPVVQTPKPATLPGEHPDKGNDDGCPNDPDPVQEDDQDGPPMTKEELAQWAQEHFKKKK